MVGRYLVATMYKSVIKSRGGRGLSLIVRIVFAIVVGMVAHPMVLLIFGDGISQTISENR
jgi:hypothetical protein